MKALRKAILNTQYSVHTTSSLRLCIREPGDPKNIEDPAKSLDTDFRTRKLALRFQDQLFGAADFFRKFLLGIG